MNPAVRHLARRAVVQSLGRLSVGVGGARRRCLGWWGWCGIRPARLSTIALRSVGVNDTAHDDPLLARSNEPYLSTRITIVLRRQYESTRARSAKTRFRTR